RGSPLLPRRLPALPQVIEMKIVAVSVHGVPETLVEIDRELAVAGQVAQRLLLQEEVRIVVQVVEDLALEDEEAAAHDALRRGLLVELHGLGAVDSDLAVAGAGVHAGDGGDAPLRPVKIQQGVDVHVAHGVAVGEAEGLGVEVPANLPEPSAGRRLSSGLGAGDPPALEAV